MKNTPLTFEQIIELLNNGEKSIHCKFKLNECCYSSKDVYFESDSEVEIFNYIDESRKILNKKEFEKHYGSSLFFDSFN